MHMGGYPCERIDGSTASRDRQAAIDRFSKGGCANCCFHLPHTSCAARLGTHICFRSLDLCLQRAARASSSCCPRAPAARASHSQRPIPASSTTAVRPGASECFACYLVQSQPWHGTHSGQPTWAAVHICAAAMFRCHPTPHSPPPILPIYCRRLEPSERSAGHGSLPPHRPREGGRVGGARDAQGRGALLSAGSAAAAGHRMLL